MSTWVLIFLIYFLNSGHVTKVESKEGFGPGEQEWGFVKVRNEAHMFWWLYYVNPPVKPDNFSVFTKPLIIWLQGGPGASSTGYGNFAELGPLDIDLQRRNHTWVNDYNVLFIDNPVGSGFSYVETNSSYATTNLQIAEDLLICMKAFLEVVPEFKNVSTYVTAESYGGKMAAEFALLWDQAQNKEEIKSKFKGIVLIDSWISPIDSILSWAPFLLHAGMVDSTGYELVKKSAEETEEAAISGNWSLATELWGITELAIFTVTENIDFYNILEKVEAMNKTEKCYPLPKTVGPLLDEDGQLDIIMNGEVKKALGVNVTWGAQQGEVFDALVEDFMKPVIDIIERLLNETNLQVLVLTGQLDLIVATPGTVAWVEKLKWKGAEKWRDSSRNSLSVNSIIEGYIKEYDNFKLYWISRAGHMIPRDNPDATKSILQSLTTPKMCINDKDNNINSTDTGDKSQLLEKTIKKGFRKSRIFRP